MLKKVICYTVVIGIAAGIIATVLAVLMIPSISEPTKPDEPSPPLEGEFVYVEVQGLGNVQGRKSVQGTAIFAGIPFSKPPTGEFRWQKPRRVTSLEYEGNAFDATYARPGCAQICDLPSPQYVCPDVISEDCLHLVVNVPSRLTKEVTTNEGHFFTLVDNIESYELTVMVFFYGGAFIAGSNGVALYDARFIAEKGDVIVVVPNYRLGPFGSFYQNNGNADPALGNFMIWDQIEALKWVQTNIRYFGGDPSKVTIFGQSAGAQSVGVHLVNDHSKPLFRHAIMESNPFGITFKTTEEAQETSDKFVTSSSSCTPNDMACLRGLSMEEILDGLENFSLLDQFNPNSLSQLFEPWAPIIDNDILTQHSYYTFLEGKNHDKPIIFGTTTDEGMFFVIQALAEPSTNNRQYNLLLNALFGDKSAEVKALYPADCKGLIPPPDCDNRYTINDVVTDYMFTCPSRHVFSDASRLGDPAAPIWWYTFDQQWSFPQFWENYTACYNLSCHSAELPYVFDVDTLTEYRFTPEELELAHKMIFYWTNFAKYGNPNPSSPLKRHARFADLIDKFQSLPGDYPPTNVEFWPRMYEDGAEGSAGAAVVYKTIKLTASGGEVIDDFMKTQCDLFDSVDLYLNDSIKLNGIRPLGDFKRDFGIF